MKYYDVIAENEKKIFIGVFEKKCFYRIGSRLPKEHFAQSLTFRKREASHTHTHTHTNTHTQFLTCRRTQTHQFISAGERGGEG